jgi:hypothetical protein
MQGPAGRPGPFPRRMSGGGSGETALFREKIAFFGEKELAFEKTLCYDYQAVT